MNNSPGWASPGSDRPDTSRPDTSDAAPGTPGETDGPTGEAPGTSASGTGQSEPHAAPGAPQADPPADGQSPQPQDFPPPNWSRNQPPPASWNTPGTPGPGGASQQPGVPGQYVPPPPPGPSTGTGPGGHDPGRTGPPGWNHGVMPPGPNPYWGPPTAPKPGVIPLRPLSIGEIFEGAISTVRAHWRTVLSISVVVAFITVTASTLATGLFFNHNPDLDKLRNDPQPSLGDLAHLMANALAGDAVTLVIGLLGQIVATAMLIMIVSRSVLGRQVTIGEVWNDARPRVPRMIGLTLLIVLIGVATMAVGVAPGVVIALTSSETAGSGLAMLGGLAAAIVALWLLISFSLATPTLMLEKQGVRASLARSFKLVRGSWWRVLGVQLLATLIFFVANAIVQIPFSVIATLANGGSSSLLTGGVSVGWASLIITGTGTIVGSTFTLPLSAGITSLLYMDQRIRREGLDIELARAAGV